MTRAACDIAVVGAGAFGLAIALRLARAGASVRLLDRPPQLGPNASAVAAGMLAPVSETLAENGDREHLDRLMLAREAWPDFAESVRGISLDRAGTDLRLADEAAVKAIMARLAGWGIDSPRLAGAQPGVHLADDWRLDPLAAITALEAALVEHGVSVESGQVTVSPAVAGAGPSLRFDDDPLRAGRVVIAAGHHARDLAAAAPELAVLSPIKGQLAVFAPGGPGGPAVRAEAGYFVPQPSGARFGATMQAGRDDTLVDAEVLARQHAAALNQAPGLAGLASRGEAGVRAATPDGWPLIGPSSTPGLFLAAGARRNGWLLAPLVSRMLSEQLTGGPPHPLAEAFHPGRFTR